MSRAAQRLTSRLQGEADCSSEDLEQSLWMVLESVRRDVTAACNGGYGSPALREAAEALDGPQQILERERARRQLRDAWYASEGG